MVNRISFWYWCVADTCGQFWCYLSWPSSTVHRCFFIELSSLHFQTDPNSFYPTDTVMMPPFNKGLNCVFNGIFMTAKAITCLSKVTLIPLRFLRGGKRPYGCSAKALMSRAWGNGALEKTICIKDNIQHLDQKKSHRCSWIDLTLWGPFLLRGCGGC